MRAMLEANREQSAAERESRLKEFPKPETQPEWTSLDYDVTQEEIAA